jgi:RNA polymerase sigma-70 factor (ECF subfamily)
MVAPGNTTTKLQFWLDLMQAGDGQARQELMGHACERLRKLTRRMLRGYPLVRRWEQTDDVLQNSMMRLYRALADLTPESLRHFYSLAGVQIRRELLDLAKHHARSDGAAEREMKDEADESDDPSNLAEWTEFHEQVEALPDDEREVFNLLWYEELTQAEAAEILGIAVRTVIRRWQAARVRLYRVLQEEAQDDGRNR